MKERDFSEADRRRRDREGDAGRGRAIGSLKPFASSINRVHLASAIFRIYV